MFDVKWSIVTEISLGSARQRKSFWTTSLTYINPSTTFSTISNLPNEGAR
jgi:hypothetical protein